MARASALLATGEDSSAATASTALESSLDSINSLRWPTKLAIEGIAIGGRFRVCRERAHAERESWLRRSAENGDFYAMESLGLRLFTGHGLTHASTEGLGWLRRSAELGNPIAMERLAECLLDTEPSSDATAEAIRWLTLSVERGNTHAGIVLGCRLIVGAGFSADPSRGKELLVNAAGEGSQLAHIKLGTYLLVGRGLNQDRREGLRWLRRIGAKDANHMSVLAYYVYIMSLAAPTMGTARILADEAAVLFYEAVQQGNDEEAVNLAYLLRRGEISDATYPSIEKLLVPYVKQGKPAALINQALRMARGIECATDWEAADMIVAKFKARMQSSHGGSHAAKKAMLRVIL